MDVLHLSARDNQGGAARATYRLHRGLLDAEVNSQMLVQKKRTTDETVYGVEGVSGFFYDGARRKIDSLPVYQYRSRNPELFSPAWLPERRLTNIRRIDPDIIHLHWITGGFITPETISELDKPLIWTLHDMWPFTGGCHIAKDCTKYTDRCGECPHLNSSDSTDLSRSVWKRKNEAWKDLKFNIVTPSPWLADCVQKSSLLSGNDIRVIPNGLDINSFRPREPNTVREELGLDPEAKLVCFGASRDTHNKGADLFFEALEHINTSHDHIQIALFGQVRPPEFSDAELSTINVGYIEKEVLKGLYSDADVVVIPSRMESFGQMASESLASGTPVVGFNATGIKHIVDHKDTGYLADPYDPEDLAQGIDWVLEEPDRNKKLSKNGREAARDRFDISRVVEQYHNLYKQFD